MATTHSRLSSFPTYSLKAGYTARSNTILCTTLQVLTWLVREAASLSKEFPSSSHNTGSPRKPGRMLHAIGARPRSLTPSTHPKLGVKSRHQGLHRCALHRIFRPYLEEAVLTRILRRQNVYYHRFYEYSRGNCIISLNYLDISRHNGCLRYCRGVMAVLSLNMRQK